MGISNFGIGAGAATEGYYRGKGIRDESEERDYQKGRVRKLQKLLDDEALKEAERTAERNAASAPGRLAQVGIDDRASERGDIAGGLEHEQTVAGHPGAMQDIANQDELRSGLHENKSAGIAYEANADRRADKLGGQNERIADASVGPTIKEIERQETENTYIGDLKSKVREATQAMETFKETDNLQVLEDFYNRSIEDGNEITIKQVGTDKYIMQGSDGRPVTTTKGEIIQGFQDTFMNERTMHEYYGKVPVQYSGKEGYGGALGVQGRMVETMVGHLRSNPENADKSDSQLWLDAFTYVTQKAGAPVEQQAQALFAALMKSNLKTDYGTPTKDDVTQAQRSAALMTAQFAMTFNKPELAQQILQQAGISLDDEPDPEEDGIKGPRKRKPKGGTDHIGNVLKETVGR